MVEVSSTRLLDLQREITKRHQAGLQAVDECATGMD